MPAGRPEKEADPKFPKRAASIAAKKAATSTSETTPVKAASETGTNSDGSIGVKETDKPNAAKTVEQTYICDTCESPLTKTDGECPICHAGLSWDGL